MLRRRFVWGVVGLAVLLTLPLSATTVVQMDLEQLCDHADKIFRGTVVDVSQGTVQAGGSQLPTVTYRLKVEESFKGEFESVKGESFTEITMLGSLKAPANGGAVRAFQVIPGIPQLAVGHDYLLMTTPPSSIGLSVPVGLGQGTFEIQTSLKEETAINGAENVGLTLESQRGPMSYESLAAQIRNLVQ